LKYYKHLQKYGREGGKRKKKEREKGQGKEERVELSFPLFTSKKHRT
jgi:hypothetical protein